MVPVGRLIQLGKHLGTAGLGRYLHQHDFSGDFPTDLNRIARDYREEMRNYIPGKRVRERNIAGAAIFLASEAVTIVLVPTLLSMVRKRARYRETFFADKMTTVDLNK